MEGKRLKKPDWEWLTKMGDGFTEKIGELYSEIAVDI